MPESSPAPKTLLGFAPPVSIPVTTPDAPAGRDDPDPPPEPASTAAPAERTHAAPALAPAGRVDPAVPAQRADPSTARFREQALAAHERGDSPAAPLDVSPPSTWAFFFLLASLVATAVAFCFFGHVEVTARGRGALRTAAGVIPIQAETGGLIAEVHVRSGQRVRAGELLVTIDAANMKAALLEAEKRLAFVSAQLAPSAARRRAYVRERQRLLDERAALIKETMERQEESTTRSEQHRQDFATLGAQGIVGRHQQDEVDEAVTDARRKMLGLRQELAQTLAERSALAAELENEQMSLADELDQARARRDAAALVLRQTAITAPRDGIVEAIIVRPGELVTAGAPVGKLIPPGAPARVIAFVEERHRAFLRPGSEVRLEVDQLPVGEFGPLAGRIDRIGDDLASAVELRDALGEAGGPLAPQYRVEIALDESHPRLRQLPAELRAGMLVTVRYALRERRIITLVLEPLRKWLN